MAISDENNHKLPKRLAKEIAINWFCLVFQGENILKITNKIIILIIKVKIPLNWAIAHEKKRKFAKNLMTPKI